MHKFLHEETPAKVFSLLGVALFALAFMLGVSVTEATFSGTSAHLPDPFGPKAVMAVADSASSAYSDYVYAVLINPTKADWSEAVQNVAWVWDNSKYDVAYAFGLDGVVSGGQHGGEVAGAYTSVAAPAAQSSGQGLSIDTLYEVLLK